MGLWVPQGHHEVEDEEDSVSPERGTVPGHELCGGCCHQDCDRPDDLLCPDILGITFVFHHDPHMELAEGKTEAWAGRCHA